MFLIFFAFIIIAIFIYFVIGAAIIFHLKKYGIEGTKKDLTPKMIWLFVGVSILFILGLIFLFIGTPWESII